MIRLVLLVILVVPMLVKAQSNVYIIAGNGTSGFSGDGGSATSASFRSTQGICMDSLGNLYIADVGNQRVRKINPSGIVTTIAGTGTNGYSGDGGLATAAQLSFYGVECDPVGNLLIGDWNNNRIRRVDAATRIITTVAGNGTAGSLGDGGYATVAEIRRPIEAIYDAAHNIIISEYGAGKIRKVDGATGIITTIATASSPDQIARLNGNIYVALQSGSVIKIDKAGTTSTFAGGGVGIASGVPATSTSLAGSQGVAIDCHGNVYIADNDHELIRKVDVSTGIITTIAGGGSLIPSITGVPALSAKFHNELICFDNSGNLYVSTDNAPVVYMVSNVSNCGPFVPSGVSPCDTFPRHTDTGVCARVGPIKLYAPVGYTSPIWSTGEMTSNITVPNSGTYWVKTMIDTCSLLMDTFNISVIPTPIPFNLGPDTALCTQYKLSIQANANETYLWSDGSKGQSIEISKTGTYWAAASNICGNASDTINISFGACDVALPTAFSPNGDGKNDVLYVRGTGIKTLDLKIYNRFGQLVFETTDQKNGWDGTHNGQPQPTEVYCYILSASISDGTQKILKGNITLLR